MEVQRFSLEIVLRESWLRRAGEPALLHASSSRLDYEKTPVLTGRVFRGQVSGIHRKCEPSDFLRL